MNKLKYFVNFELQNGQTVVTSLATRGHPYKLYKAQCDNPKRRSFFTERIVNV